MPKLTDAELMNAVKSAGITTTLIDLRKARAKIDEIGIRNKHDKRFTTREYQEGDLGVIHLTDIAKNNKELTECLLAAGKIYIILEDGNARIFQWHDPNKMGHHPIMSTDLVNIAEAHRQMMVDAAANGETVNQIIANL